MVSSILETFCSFWVTGKDNTVAERDSYHAHLNPFWKGGEAGAIAQHALAENTSVPTSIAKCDMTPRSPGHLTRALEKNTYGTGG